MTGAPLGPEAGEVAVRHTRVVRYRALLGTEVSPSAEHVLRRSQGWTHTRYEADMKKNKSLRTRRA